MKAQEIKNAQVLNALREAVAVKYVPARASGCGRAYVCIGVAADKATLKAVAAGCKDLSLIFQARGYKVGPNAIYIGYDNASGQAIGRSEAFAKVLQSHGISAYPDAAED